MEIKAGDKVKVLLLSTKTPPEVRMFRGIDRDAFEGTARFDLELGKRFTIDIPDSDIKYLSTSPVQRIGENIIHTENSSYSVEKL